MANQSQPSPVPEVQIQSRGAFRVAGLRYEGKGAPGEIPALWDNQFLPRMDELASIRVGREAYGVSRAKPDFDKTGVFEYLAAVEVKSFDYLPQGMVGWAIPAQTYAVLPANDVPGISPMLDYYYHQWLLQSKEYVAADGPMFELYPATYSQDLIIYLYNPIGPR